MTLLRFWQSPIHPASASCGNASMSSTCCWTSFSRTTFSLIAAPPSLRTSTVWRESQWGEDFLFTLGCTGSPTGALFFFCAWCRICEPSWRPSWPGSEMKRTSLSGYLKPGSRSCTGQPWRHTRTSAPPGTSWSSFSTCSLSLGSPEHIILYCGWPGWGWQG